MDDEFIAVYVLRDTKPPGRITDCEIWAIIAFAAECVTRNRNQSSYIIQRSNTFYVSEIHSIVLAYIISFNHTTAVYTKAMGWAI